MPVLLLIFSLFFLSIHIYLPARRNVAFAASLTQITGCFGPFNKNVSISYCNVTLNQGYGYNQALGEHPFKIHTPENYSLA